MATQLAPGLARKVKKVLETRADTPETIACLKGLSEFYGENTPAARRGARSRACRNLHPVSALRAPFKVPSVHHPTVCIPAHTPSRSIPIQPRRTAQ